MVKFLRRTGPVIALLLIIFGSLTAFILPSAPEPPAAPPREITIEDLHAFVLRERLREEREQMGQASKHEARRGGWKA